MTAFKAGPLMLVGEGLVIKTTFMWTNADEQHESPSDVASLASCWRANRDK